MLRGKNPYVFVRFGGLDLKNQYGYAPNQKSYHSPPCSRGIYAMPKIAQEFFLLGGIGKRQVGILPKNFNGSDSDWWNRVSLVRKEFEKKDGYIWHHLEEYIRRNEVVDVSGSWIKTDIKTWAKSFSKMSTTLRLGRHKILGCDEIIPIGIIGCYSKDHCEVFFDEKV